MLLKLATTVLVFLIWTPVASAWSWPVQGPVLQPFAYDESQPYASGQHRGIDIRADATGSDVVAPAAGTVTFAGTVPTSGESVTIETSAGYSVTLTHLGSTIVAKGATVAEGTAVGTIGPTGTPEVDGPYVHLGIRIAADPDGYVDPLGLLPPVTQTGGDAGGSTTTQPVASGGSSSAPAPAPVSQSAPAPAAAPSAPVASSQGPTVQARPAHLSRQRHAQKPRVDSRTQRSSQPSPVSHPAKAERRVEHRPRVPQHRVSETVSASRRPVVEVTAPEKPTGLDPGHESTPSVPAKAEPQPADWLGLACNGAAALVAVAAAFCASRRRRRTILGVKPQVLHLPVPTAQDRRAA